MVSEGFQVVSLNFKGFQGFKGVLEDHKEHHRVQGSLQRSLEVFQGVSRRSNAFLLFVIQ